jgi:hypothetical protein
MCSRETRNIGNHQHAMGGIEKHIVVLGLKSSACRSIVESAAVGIYFEKCGCILQMHIE